MCVVKTKKKSKKASRAPAHRHYDSVVVGDDEAPRSRYEPDEPPTRALVRVEPLEEHVGVSTNVHDTAVRNAARDLVLQAKQAAQRAPGHHPSHVTLILEDNVEIDAGIMLEHQGRGRLFQDPQEGDAWCFEFHEDSPSMGGVLRGDTLTDTKG